MTLLYLGDQCGAFCVCNMSFIPMDTGESERKFRVDASLRKSCSCSHVTCTLILCRNCFSTLNCKDIKHLQVSSWKGIEGRGSYTHENCTTFLVPSRFAHIYQQTTTSRHLSIQYFKLTANHCNRFRIAFFAHYYWKHTCTDISHSKIKPSRGNLSAKYFEVVEKELMKKRNYYTQYKR